MYMRCLYCSPQVCGKVLDNLCIKVYFCGKVCVLMYSGHCDYVLINVSRSCTYILFNVLRSCDLSEQSITTPRKCQDRRHKFFEGLTVKKHQKPL